MPDQRTKKLGIGSSGRIYREFVFNGLQSPEDRNTLKDNEKNLVKLTVCLSSRICQTHRIRSIRNEVADLKRAPPIGDDVLKDLCFNAIV